MERDDAIERIDEQINKLKSKEPVKKEEASTSNDTTKVFEVEESDTKVFDKDELVESKTEEVELLEDLLETKKEEVVVDKVVDSKKEIPKKKKSKKPIVIGVITSLIVLVLCIFIPSLTSAIGDSKPVKVEGAKKFTEKQKEEIIKKYGEALESVIGVYYSKQNILLEYDDAVKLVEFDEEINCSVHEIYKNGKVYLNKCSINGIKNKYTYGEKQVDIVSEDEKLYVYVEKVSKKASLRQPSGSTYDMYTVHCGSKYSDPEIIGEYVLYYDADYNLQMKNYKSDEKILKDFTYQSVWPIKTGEKKYDSKYILVKAHGFWGVYDYVTGNQVISPMYTGFLPVVTGGAGDAKSVSTVGNNLIVAWNGNNYGVFNYVTNRSVISFDYVNIMATGNYIWAVDANGEGFLFDQDGNRLLENKYTKVYDVLFGENVLVLDTEEIKLINVSGTLKHNYGKIDNIGRYDYGVYYNDQVIFRFFNSQSEEDCFELIYDIKTKEGSTKSVKCR